MRFLLLGLDSKLGFLDSKIGDFESGMNSVKLFDFNRCLNSVVDVYGSNLRIDFVFPWFGMNLAENVMN